MKDKVHQALESCSGIPLAGRHAKIAVCPLWGGKASFYLIILGHVDLVIARVGVHEALKFTSGRGVDQLVDARKGIVVLWAFFVEVGEVHAHAPFPIGLLNQFFVSEPVGVPYMANGVGLGKLFGFHFNRLDRSADNLHGLCLTGTCPGFTVS